MSSIACANSDKNSPYRLSFAPGFCRNDSQFVYVSVIPNGVCRVRNPSSVSNFFYELVEVIQALL